MTVRPERGGRLASLTIDGRGLLVTEAEAEPDPDRPDMLWGSYPMVPWAGRIRHGRFSFRGTDVELPRNLGDHAGHGVGFDRPWDVVDETTITCRLGEPWPFGGVATQRFDLDEGGLTTTMTVAAEADMPVMVGWHPWFTKVVAGPDGRAVPAELRFAPGQMYELDAEAIPTGALVAPPPGPWDNSFVGLSSDPVISWPGLVTIRLSSSCDHWVVYDQPAHALCVEPQSAAPDVFNREPTVVAAGEELTAWYRISWA